MSKFFLLVITSIFSFSLILKSQEVSHNWCATPEKNRIELERNPEAQMQRMLLEQFTRNYVEDVFKSQEIYTIPVVFHIVHDYGEENISYAQILEAIEFLNNDFRKLRSDSTQIVNEFKSIAADTKIEFRLARLDPDGNCTKGVTRTASQTTHGGGNSAKYAAPSWPREMYLNVWVVRALPRGAAGWAYYPGTAGQGLDGIILLHSYTGSTGTSSKQRGSTLTHEVGHYLNLMHPWGGTNEPGLPENCEISDEVHDTPNTIGHTTCNLSGFSCGSLDNVQNFMEYSYCHRMFTYGQAERMRAALNHTASARNNLWTEQNLWATGTHPDYSPELCPPLADFYANKRLGCIGTEVEFYNFTYNTETVDSVKWFFDGANISKSNDFYPNLNYVEAGRHAVQMYAYNQAGYDMKTKQEFMHIYDPDDGLSVPYNEYFDNPAFPYIENSSNGFYFVNFGQANWHKTYDVAYKGIASIKIKPGDNRDGSRNSVMLPILKLNSTDNPLEVSFYSAYGRVNNQSTDRLRFYISENCGESRRIVHVLDAPSLATAVSSSQANYIPMPNHWKKHSFIINPGLINCTNLRLIIEVESGGGNNIYIDNISISSSTNIGISEKTEITSVYPNPFTKELLIDLHHYQGNNVNITFFDSSGQVIGIRETGEEIYNAYDVFHDKAPGLYLIKISTDNNYETIRVVKQ